MKKICFVKFDMQVSGGGERVCTNLANALSSGCEVHVVSICSEKELPFYPLNENVKYSVLMRGSGRIREVIVKGTRLLHKYLLENSIDVVLAVGVSVNPFVVFGARNTKCRVISCEHLNCLSDYENDFTQRLCRSIGAKYADKIITLTKADSEAYIEKYKLSPQKLDYIYNWADDSLISDENSYTPGLKRILSVVRIIPIKGVENIIKVSKRLKEQFSDWQWHIYGGGEEEYVCRLQKMIDENGLGDFVVLKGRVNDMYSLYNEYSLFVLTSYCEGLPMTLIEAKARRIPCISFDCLTGPRDIIRDGEDGYLVPVDDLDCLYEKICACMSSENLRKELSDNAYGNINLFSQSEIIKKWIKLIGE